MLTTELTYTEPKGDVMELEKRMAVAESLVSLGLLSRANSLLYVHGLPERLVSRMYSKWNELDAVGTKSLRDKRAIGCTSKLKS
jgi:hypothetical protein